ncbi:MAG: TonB-dependent receptor [Bacteroidia bacterium]|nr:TonB-dependent receptor [Bacteroidia bacterium]
MNYSRISGGVSPAGRAVRSLCLLLMSWCCWVGSVSGQVTGTVTSGEDGTALPGVTIFVKGAQQGALTDDSGRFSIAAPADAVLIFRYYGFLSQEVPVAGQAVLNITLQPEVQTVGEVVVVGYGTQRKKDLTGAITSVSAKDFVQGNIATPEQLIAGKVAGVQITSNGGAPGSGSRIRIRGGSSLNASNDPLIVIDGVPVDNNGISGAANPLSLINPNDIESFVVLKDASATAIYGSRAANGVIIVTTKKGKQGDAFQVNFSTVLSSAQKTGTVAVLSAEEFREVVNEKGTPAQVARLGQATTDWQEEIYRTAYSQDHNLSITGSVPNLPYRVSVGYLNQNGILKTSNLERISAAVGLAPSLLDDKLRVDINLKGSSIRNHFADQGAIGSAVVFDPTQPVFSPDTAYLGYYEWLDPATGKPNTLAPRNPVGLLDNKSDESTVLRSIGNVQFDYRFHFLPELRANLNLGYDISESNGTVTIPAASAISFNRGGNDEAYTQNKLNKTLDFYLNYVKELNDEHRIDLMGGYSFQDFIRENSFTDYVDSLNNIYYKTQNTLVSFYGRLNYAFRGKYLLTATLREDGSSRFGPGNRWGTFPSVGLAWQIKDEAFLKDVSFISDLKLRAGYGITGQQDVLSDYPYLARYTLSEVTAQYPFGNIFYSTLRPEGYDANIRWEQTTTLNAGLDFGLANGRISGSVDYYVKQTEDLLSVIPVPAGSNLTNRILTNVGNIENRGVEFLLNLNPVRTQSLNWDFGVNVTYNQNTITNLTRVPDPDFVGIETGGIAGGVGNTIQIHTVGYPTYSFFVYKQVYDETGAPKEGDYEDLNADGLINADDRYRYKTPEPRVFMGINTQLTYKKLTLSTVLRASLGNYMYNNLSSNNGAYRNFSAGNNFLSNLVPSVLETNFQNNQYFTDYYIENASFLRMDNLVLGYALPGLRSDKIRVQVSAIAQNVFVLTSYSGLDPEIAGGIDNNFYPRPRTLSLSINLNFL